MADKNWRYSRRLVSSDALAARVPTSLKRLKLLNHLAHDERAIREAVAERDRLHRAIGQRVKRSAP